jgi:hypothetical protein
MMRRLVLVLASSLAGCGGRGAAPSGPDGSTDGGSIDGPSDAWHCTDDASCAVTGTPIIEGTGLTVQDVSDDGITLAYTDAAGNLFVVPTDGGAPAQVATGVDRARCRGPWLAIYQGLDALGVQADTMLLLPQGTTTPLAAGTFVLVATVDASPDGEHYAFVAKQTSGGSVEDVILDGNVVVAGSTKERARFSPASNYLVVSSTVATVKRLQAFPLAGGSPVTLAPSGAAKRFSITPDGAIVVFGANDNGSLANLTRIPIGGGTTTPLVAGASRRAFRVLEDGLTLAFLYPPSALEAIQLDGTGLLTLVGSGATDIIQTSSHEIVYATLVDSTTGLATLRIIDKDGTADTALGSAALDEGFAPGEGFYIFRDGVVGQSGELRGIAQSGGPLFSLGARVNRSSFADAGRVVFLDDSYALRKASLATGAVALLEDGVGSYNVVPDAPGASSSRVAFAIPADPGAGIYVAPIGDGP